MIKVLIVVSGLVAFVPNRGNDPIGLTALLPDTASYAALVGGNHMKHQVAMYRQINRFVADGPQRRELLRENEFKAVFRVQVGGKLGAIDLAAQKDFVQLEALPRSPGSQVIEECLTGNCKMVAAMVRFEGTWRTRPLVRCNKYRWAWPVDFNEEVQLDFRRVSDIPLDDDNPAYVDRRLATALALETQVADARDLIVEIGGKTGKGKRRVLGLSTPETCALWLGEHVKSCIVVEIENWPEHEAAGECGGVPPRPPECMADEHFAIFYDLLTSQPPWNDRWIPVATAASCVLDGNTEAASLAKAALPSEVGPGNPPSPRCPPVWINR